MDELICWSVCRSPETSIIGIRVSRAIDPPSDIQQAGTNAVLGLKVLVCRGQGRGWFRRRSWWPLDLVVDAILTLRARKFPPSFA